MTRKRIILLGPSSNNDSTPLQWNTAKKMLYNEVYLLVGGFALVMAFVRSGLLEFLGDQFAALNLACASLVFLMITTIIPN
jgi:hypothetical protein